MPSLILIELLNSMIIHVECIPDEALLRKLGYTRKQVLHHGGKSKVFNYLSNNERQWAMVDEDPGASRHPYEEKLTFKEEKYKIKYFSDRRRNNIVLVLRPKLEDWILDICSKECIDLKQFGLPTKSNDLHDVINIRLVSFDKLVDHLLTINNPSIYQLKSWLDS